MIKYLTIFLFFYGMNVFSQEKNAAFVSYESLFSFEETCTKLENAFLEFKLQTFACIDHSQNAEEVGLSLLGSRVYLVGNPKAGTPLMAEIPEMAIYLPLKFLVFEKAKKTFVMYQNITPLLLQHSHNEATKNLSEKIDHRMQLLLKTYFPKDKCF